MDHGHLGSFVRSTQGGVFTATAGVVWESVEVAERLSYLREAGSSLDWRSLAAYMWHPSPLTLFGVGVAWVIVSFSVRKKPRELAEIVPAPIELPRADEYQVDVPPKAVELAQSGHDVIIKDVRIRTIVVRAATKVKPSDKQEGEPPSDLRFSA